MSRLSLSKGKLLDVAWKNEDSIVRVFEEKPLVLRRSRGYVPRPIELGFECPHVLACGADMKNAVCDNEGPACVSEPVYWRAF